MGSISMNFNGIELAKIESGSGSSSMNGFDDYDEYLDDHSFDDFTEEQDDYDVFDDF